MGTRKPQRRFREARNVRPLLGLEASGVLAVVRDGLLHFLDFVPMMRGWRFVIIAIPVQLSCSNAPHFFGFCGGSQTSRKRL